MLFFSILYLFHLDFIYTLSDEVSDLCDKKQFSQFTYASKRSVNYNQTTSLSDRFIREGWYGKMDFRIPSAQPARGHCGTISPIFLQSKPDGKRRTVQDMTVCINDCENIMIIKAVKCSERLTVYRLKRSLSSNAAYCLDGIEAVLNFSTNVAASTALRTVPDAEGRKEYIFDCSFPDPDNGSLTYQATWFVNDVVVYESPYTDYNDVNKDRSLTDTKLKAGGVTTVGFQLYCEIKAGMVIKGTRGFSFPSTSKQQFIGMKVLKPVINIQEGGTATIEILSSVPIGCEKNYGCKLSVTADIPKGGEDANQPKCEPNPRAEGGCGVTINTTAWESMYKIQITSTITEDYAEKLTERQIFLRTDTLFASQPIWQNYFLDTIKINIAKDTRLIEGKSCIFHSDPYLFDFYSRLSTFRLNGTFYLLKMKNVEVQVQVTDCSGRLTGYCVCGVVVRVGRTAFMINHCNLDYWFIDYILCDDGGDILDVRIKKEKEFEMYLPSDTKIEITLRDESPYHWLNIYIYPSVKDIGNTSGLCGELTEDKPVIEYNDAYYNTWRVDGGLSLFNPENWKSLRNWTSMDTRFQHCSCAAEDKIEGTLNCTAIQRATTCSSDDDYKLFHKKRCIKPSRKKRSLTMASQSSILRHQRLRRDVSWKNGWTLNSASEYCSDLFNKSMVIKRCEGIKGINIEESIETCVSDIRLSGTDVFALSAISSVSSQCLREARMNRTLREEKVEEGKTILELVKEVACPGECSDHGSCKNGKCICNSGYISSDCSVPLSEPPVAHSLEADGYCDIQEDDCSEVAVFGGRFVDHSLTKCRYISFKITDNQVTVSEENEIQTAEFESIGEVTCKLPSRKRKRSIDEPVIDETVTGYKVSVSNNGQDYSQQLNLIIYNTECMNCTVDSDDMKCSFSPSYCIMGNSCYQSGSMYNADDREFVCRADSNGKDWLPIINGTVVDTTKSPTTTDSIETTLKYVTEDLQTTDIIETTMNDVTRQTTETTLEDVTESPSTSGSTETTMHEVTAEPSRTATTDTTMDEDTENPPTTAISETTMNGVPSTKVIDDTTLDDVTENPSTTAITGSTTDDVNRTPPTTEKQTDYVVIGISVTAAVVFIIICLIIFCVSWRRKSKAPRSSEVGSPTSNPSYDCRNINPYDNAYKSKSFSPDNFQRT